MKRAAAFLLLAPIVSFPQSLDGDYNFVNLRLKQGDAATLIAGALKIQGATAEYRANIANGSQAAQAINGSSAWTKIDAFSNSLSGPPGPDLRVRSGYGLLLGTNRNPDAEHNLFLGVKKPASAPSLSGRFSGAFLRFKNGVSSEAETGHVVFELRDGTLYNISLVSHEANLDGVNRATNEGQATLTLAADGTGTVNFTGKGKLAGKRNVIASAEGNLLVAASLEGPNRDLIIALRDADSATEDVLTGGYWIAEIGGDTPYAQQASALKLSSGDGALLSFANGQGAIGEQVSIDGKAVDLTTSVRYRLGSGPERILAPVIVNGVRNLAITDDLGLMVASWTGRVDQLTLQHGLLFGIRAARPPLAALVPGAIAAAPGGLLSLFGQRLARQTAFAPALPLPAELGGVKVTANGAPAGLWMVSPQHIGIQIPADAKPGDLTIEVKSDGATSSVTIPVVASAAPNANSVIATHADLQLVTEQSPAKPGEPLSIFISGANLSPKESFQVLFNGVAARIETAAPSTKFPGLFQITAITPNDKNVAGQVVLGIRTADAYNDLGDVTIAR